MIQNIATLHDTIRETPRYACVNQEYRSTRIEGWKDKVKKIRKKVKVMYMVI